MAGTVATVYRMDTRLNLETGDLQVSMLLYALGKEAKQVELTFFCWIILSRRTALAVALRHFKTSKCELAKDCSVFTMRTGARTG